MAGGRDRGCRGQVPIEEVPHRGRNIRDKMIEDLQRQVAELTQRLMAQNLGRRGQVLTEEVPHLDHYRGQVPVEEVPHLDHDEEDYYSRGQIPAEEVPKYFSCRDCDEEFYDFESSFDNPYPHREQLCERCGHRRDLGFNVDLSETEEQLEEQWFEEDEEEVEEYGEPAYDECEDEVLCEGDEALYEDDEEVQESEEPVYDEYDDGDIEENELYDNDQETLVLYEDDQETLENDLYEDDLYEYEDDLVPGSSLVTQRENISVAEALSRTFSILSVSNSRTSSFQHGETDAGRFQAEDDEWSNPRNGIG